MNTLLPTLFLSHGSPMQAVQETPTSRAWKALAQRLPRPRAILMASAHWETAMPMLTGGTAPETIHDFGGFPEQLYRLRYAAPGAPDVAAEAVAALARERIAAGIDRRRGLDHGAWVPLLWMYPEADVPVVQLSIQTALGARHHVQVGRALAPLAREGILIVASGHATHNLRDWMMGPRDGEPLPYARAFADWLHDRLVARDLDALADYRKQAPGATRAHPSEEHFLPLFVALGAAADGATAETVLRAYEGSALATDAYLFRQAA